MEIKILSGATFRLWGEKGSKRRFLQWRHPKLSPPVTLILEEVTIAQLIDALQRELPPDAYTSLHTVQ